MRKFLPALTAIFFIGSVQAQQTQGTVIYERTIQMQVQINDNNAGTQSLPKIRKDKFELVFGNNQSLWKHVDEDPDNDDAGGNGVHIQMVGPGQNDIIFCDFSSGQKTDQRELFDKKFIVQDSIHKLNWKLTGETSTVAGHLCQKAVAQNIAKSLQMNLDNGKMERKEVTDTSLITAWFTTDIPVPAGPEVQGQLPGLILSLDMNKGRMQYLAVEMSNKLDLSSIKAPTKGKKVTPAEFAVERNKMMDEMQKNNDGGGGNRIIIRN